jgi:ATP-dependent DNA ligase
VEKIAAEIPLSLFLFDLIYMDGQSQIDLPLLERRKLLVKIADPSLLAEQVLSEETS